MAENKINKLSINNQSYDLAGADVDTAIQEILNTFNSYLPLAGGTMTGPITLAGDPSADLQAATKKYVDEHGGSIPIISPESNIDDLSTGFYYIQDDDAIIPAIFTKSPEGMSGKCNMFFQGGYYDARSSDNVTTLLELLTNEKYCIYRIASGPVSETFLHLSVEHLRLGNNPTANYDAATKLYVDNAVAQVKGIPSYATTEPLDNVNTGFVIVNTLPVVWEKRGNNAYVYNDGTFQKIPIPGESPTAEILISRDSANAFMASLGYHIVTKKYADQTYVSKETYDMLNSKVQQLESSVATFRETLTNLQASSTEL